MGRNIRKAILSLALIGTMLSSLFVQPVWAVGTGNVAEQGDTSNKTASSDTKATNTYGVYPTYMEIAEVFQPMLPVPKEDGTVEWAPLDIKVYLMRGSDYSKRKEDHNISGKSNRETPDDNIRRAVQTQVFDSPVYTEEQKTQMREFMERFDNRKLPDSPEVKYIENYVLKARYNGKDAGGMRFNPATNQYETFGQTWDTSVPEEFADASARFGSKDMNTYHDKEYQNFDQGDRVDPQPPDGTEAHDTSTMTSNPKWRVTQIGEGSTGSLSPSFYAFHNDKTFDVGAGIPSGKNMTAGSAADRWYGTYTWKKWKAETDSPYRYTFHLSGYYITHENHPDFHPAVWHFDELGRQVFDRDAYYTDHWVDVRHDTSRDVDVPVDRSVEFYSISSTEFFQYANSNIYNTSYGITTISGTSSVEGTIVVNNQPQTAYSDDYGMQLGAHLSVDESNHEQSIGGLQVGADLHSYSESDLINWYDLRGKTADKYRVTVKNDSLTVNGKQYLKEDARQNSTASYDAAADTVRTTSEPLTINAADYHKDGYDIGSAQVYIPDDMENGKYGTTIVSNYIRKVPNDGAPQEHTGSGLEHIWTGTGADHGTYRQHEPVVVHTPVENYMKHIYSADGTQSATASNDTQLVVKPTASVNHQDMNNLLLDGTYTIKFDATKWLSEKTRDEWNYTHEQNQDRDGNLPAGSGNGGYSIPGMDNGSGAAWEENVMNSYVQKKQVRFPFSIAIIDEKGQRKYYPVSGDYTQWISMPNEGVKFYIPTWATESTTKFKATGEQGGVYRVQFKVEAYNTAHHTEEQERLENSKLPKYVATFDVPVNVSGIIYGFQIIGTNDKDMYSGYGGDASDSVDYSFVMNKEEKKAGTKNRLGGDIARTTLDGVTRRWDEHNILPMRNGENGKPGTSNAYSGMGMFWKGTTFAFSVKTIANLSDSDDKIVIKPTLRYYPGTGANPGKEQDVKIFYGDANGSFIPVGSKTDKDNKQTVLLGNPKFDGAWYQGNEFPSRVNDDPGYTLPNHLQDTLRHDNLSEDVFLNRKTESYTMSSIVLDKNLRIISGDEEELADNINNKRSDSGFKTLDKEITGVGDKERSEFTNSMQTWYGQYTIPNYLYVTYTKIDIDGNGKSSTFDAKRGDSGFDPQDDIDGDGTITLKDYSLVHPLSEESSIWLKKGYLVLNFDIETINGGVEHLLYDGGNAKDGGMWKKEGQKITGIPVEKQDGNGKINPETGNEGHDTFNINLQYGDIALIDMRYRQLDKYSAHIFMIN